MNISCIVSSINVRATCVVMIPSYLAVPKLHLPAQSAFLIRHKRVEPSLFDTFLAMLFLLN